MKKQFFLVLGLCCLVACTVEKNRQKISVEIPAKLKSGIKLKNESEASKFYDRNWISEKWDLLYHSSRDPFGHRMNYQSIGVPYAELVGTFVFSESEITDITEHRENLLLADGKGNFIRQNVKCFLVKIHYKVKAYTNDGTKYEVFTDPKDINWYWIFAPELTDGTYKIYDLRPSITLKFCSIAAFLKNSDELKQNTEIVKELTAIQ